MGIQAPIAAALAAAALQGFNQFNTARRQDRAAAKGLLEQSRLQRQANARLNEQLDQLERSTPVEEEQSRAAQIRDQLRRNQAIALAGIQNPGGGDDVTERANEARETAIAAGDVTGGQLAELDAPLLQRQGEGFERANVNSVLDSIFRQSRQRDFLTRLRLQGIRPSPLLNIASAGLSAFATAPRALPRSIAGASPNLGNLTPQQFFDITSAARLPGQVGTPDRRIFSIFGP